MSGRFRSGSIDNLFQSGGYINSRLLIPQYGGTRYVKSNKKRRKRRRRKPQRGRGIKKRIAGKALSLLAKNASKGLDFLSKNVKNKKIQSILNNKLIRSAVDSGSKFIESKGNKWYNE